MVGLTAAIVIYLIGAFFTYEALHELRNEMNLSGGKWIMAVAALVWPLLAVVAGFYTRIERVKKEEGFF